MRPPRIVVSACLLGEKVRYDGNDAFSEFVYRISRVWEVIKVCPEVEIGLGVPRPRIIAYKERGILRVFQPGTEKEVTWELYEFSNKFLKSLPEVEGFILKSKSPSCGIKGTKTYIDPYGRKFLKRGEGIFAKKVRELFKGVPVVDEIDLEDEKKREKFIEDIFELWREREKVNDKKLLHKWKEVILQNSF